MSKKRLKRMKTIMSKSIVLEKMVRLSELAAEDGWKFSEFAIAVIKSAEILKEIGVKYLEVNEI